MCIYLLLSVLLASSLTHTASEDLSKSLNKLVAKQTFEEAAWAKDYYKKSGDKDMFLKCGERMLALGGDPELVRITTLELAQTGLDLGNFETAQKYALEYQTLYPGTPEAKKASYIGIKAYFLSTLSPDRDQAPTQKTIELGEKFLKTYPDDTEYAKSIKDMLDGCYSKILESEINVINTYISRYKYNKREGALTAANKRLAYIKENVLPHTVNQQQRVSALETRLAQLTPKPKVAPLIASTQPDRILAQVPTTKVETKA
ncbi:outer membrane protein assembly factor BamD [Candidatus Dependentiae bacterium]|nr:outer membrane protein assembly factor BamD [Candidatus Dependentiae bacterium]